MKNISRQTCALTPPRICFFFGLLLCCIACGMNAQQQDLRFKRLTINDGLSHSWIHAIQQDKFGFIWIATDDGLDRYDGNSVRVYKKTKKDPYSLSSSSIMTLFEDSRGNLWIGTKNGLDLYDREHDRFIQSLKWPRIETIAIAEDSSQTLWIGTTLNVYRLDVIRDSIVLYEIDGGFQTNQNVRNRTPQALLSGSCSDIHVDSKNNVWIGSNRGLNLYDRRTNTFRYYIHDESDPKSIGNSDIRSIREDNQGRIWIGTSTGLDFFANAQERSTKGIFQHFQNNTSDVKSISQGAVLSLLEDNRQNLWIGTENGGLNQLHLASFKPGVNSFIRHQNDPYRSTSLGHNSIYALCQDRQGNIWIGSFGNGINILSAVNDKFTHVLSEPGNTNSLINRQVNTFLEDKNYLWIGTGGGLDRYNKKDGTFKHYVHNPSDRKSIGSNAVWALHKDRYGNFWVGTWGGGLNRFNESTETFEQYYNNPADTTSIGSNNIFSIYEDRKGNLWIGTMGGGLNLFDHGTKKFIRYDILNSGITSNYIQCIIETKKGELWFANALSFERFDRETKTFIHYTHHDADSNSLNSNKVISLFEDSKGGIWGGTNTGLNLFDPSINGFKHYSEEDGLPNNSINSILEDGKGNLWIGTNKGLSKFINAVNTPEKLEFKNYTFEDGLQSNGFNNRACYRGADGLLYFGGTGGYNVFNPDKVTINAYVPPLVITDFQIFNQSVPIGERGSSLRKSIGMTEELVLSYEQSVFSFDFASLNYISSAKNQYAYYMEGFEKDWNYVGAKHTATYTNLDPGEYVFHVKGSNNDGVWNEQGVSLPIVITPPFTKTFLFRCILFLLLLGIIYSIYKWRMQAKDLAAERQLEAALTKERNLLRTLIDNLPDAVFVKDVDCKKIIANPADLEYLGAVSETEVIGKTDYTFFPANAAAAYYEQDQSVLRSGIPVIKKEGFILDKHGNKQTVLSSRIPLRDAQGVIIGIVGVTHNITEEKRVQEALQRERTILRTLIDNIPDAIFIKDEKFRKVVANLADVRNIGFHSEQEVIGKDDFQLFPRELAEGFYADDQLVIQTGQPVINREEYIIDDEGQKRWLLTTKLPLRDETKKIIGIIGIGRDVTASKRTQEALQRERNLLRTLIDNLPDYIYVKDTNGRFMIVNKAVLNEFGFKSESEIIGKTDFDLFSNEEAARFQLDEQAIIQSGKGRFDYEGAVIDLSKEEKDRWVSAIKVPFQDAQGVVIGIIGVNHDMTDHKKTETERERLITELQTALADVKMLSGLVPICASCKKIRDDQGFWTQIESYIQDRSNAKFSHSLCPDCAQKLYPEYLTKK